MPVPFKNKTLLKILDYYKNLWALSYVSGIAHWDLETYMPQKGATVRGEALAKVSTLRQKMFLSKDFVSLIHEAEKQNDLTDEEKGVVRELTRSLKFYEKIPADFLEEFEKLTNKATVVWREAKEKNDYKLFEPYLVKIFEMNHKMADLLSYKESPYDALLDQFEEELTVKNVADFFGKIKQPLLNLKDKIVKSPLYERGDPFQSKNYDRVKMEELNRKVLAKFWDDMGRFRLDVSAHPFTTSFSNNDTRITTRYNEKGFASLMSVIHEFGHALYDLQCDDQLEMTPIQGGSSLVVHESQSRFWENFVGRSREFVEEFLPDFEKVVGRNLSVDELYFAINTVKPGLIRVDADELTYHFHIMLRFEIEKGVIEGSIKTNDLRDIWNVKMKEYLGIVPEKDSEGILQDVHWSGGMVGYFPTYSMGTFLSAQWAEKMDKLTNYEETKKWLGEHIHQYGSIYTLQDLLKKNEMEFDPTINLKHLEEKYRQIYGF